MHLEIGVDHEEKRFLAGALMFLYADMAEKVLLERVRQKVEDHIKDQGNVRSYDADEIAMRVTTMRARRDKALSMMGAQAYEYDPEYKDEFYTSVVESLARLDFVRDIMEDSGMVPG